MRLTEIEQDALDWLEDQSERDRDSTRRGLQRKHRLKPNAPLTYEVPLRSATRAGLEKKLAEHEAILNTLKEIDRPLLKELARLWNDMGEERLTKLRRRVLDNRESYFESATGLVRALVKQAKKRPG